MLPPLPFYAFLSVVLFAGSAQATILPVAPSLTYTAQVSSDHLENLQEFRNCIQYEFCSLPPSTFKKVGSKFELKVGPFSEMQFEKIINHCPLSRFKAKVSFKNQLGVSIASTPFANPDFKPYYSERKTQYLPRNLTTLIMNEMNHLNELLTGSHYQEAMESTIASVKLDTLGYKVVYDSTTRYGGAVTNHDSRKIVMGPVAFEKMEACKLVMTMRHEVDHVHQMAHVNECQAQGTPSELAEHNQRELSAYLNDILNLSHYCSYAPYWVELYTEIMGIQASSYLSRAGMGTL